MYKFKCMFRTLDFFFLLDYTFGFIICNLSSDNFFECNMHDTYLYLDNMEVYRLYAKTVDQSIEFL